MTDERTKRPETWKRIKLGAGLILVALVAVGLESCAESNSTSHSGRTAQEGETVTVALETDSVVLPCGSSEEALTEVMKWGERGDNAEFHRAAIETGSILLRNGDLMKVLDRGILKSKVRVQGTGVECWVVTEALRQKARLSEESTARNSPAARPAQEPPAVRPIPDGSNPAQTIIGTWSSEDSLGGAIDCIYRENGKLYLQMNLQLGEGKTVMHEVAERHSKGGRRFQTLESTYGGEYFIIDRAGNLQNWDRQGLIETWKKVK